MEALFIGQSYIDITFLTGHIPVGDERIIARDDAVSFGGNAVTAGFCCARLGVKPDLLCSMADDWLANMFLEMAHRYGISVHHRKVRESSLSFVMPKEGKRAIVRCRDNDFLHPFPELNLDGCRVLHVDGHQPHAALHFAQRCRESGILTSLDGGAVRVNTDEVLNYVDVAVVSAPFCEQLDKTPGQTLDYLKARGCHVGAVTLGEDGIVWFEGDRSQEVMAAVPVPLEKVIDSNGAGDIFHGAYVYSYLSDRGKSWHDHFSFARCASAHAIQHLGNENSLPTSEDIQTIRNAYAIAT